MEGNLALRKVLQQRKETTKTKKKQNGSKPIKVVYISNPMKFKASASEFRALVQEFTGRDAVFPDPSKFPATDEEFSVDPKMDFLQVKRGCEDYVPDHVAVDESVHEVTECSSSRQYESFYDIFSPDMMMENLSGVWPSNLQLETSQADR